MLVLLIEMTLPKTLLALVNADSGEIWERQHSSAQASNAVHGYLEELFEESATSAKDISLTVVVRGPGSFTGARVGFAIAQGFKSSLGIPIKTINTLQALALAYPKEKTCVLIDSFGREIYTQMFENTMPTSVPECKLPEEVTVPNGYKCVGNGVEKAGLGNNTNMEICPVEIVKFAVNNSDEIQPLYLKPLNYKKVK